MRAKLTLFIITIIIISGVGFLIAKKIKSPKSNAEVTKQINPARGVIRNTVSTTGTVLPQNRLEIKPPVNGRIEEILVKEGTTVKAGETLAWMSSTERAALLDSARGQGEKSLAYWKDVYKAIPLISPIDAEVIVATTQPGQTVTTADAVIVLSDKLIVRAQVDETDIGKIKVGQKAVITIDAYADREITAVVEHIFYESKTVNNVTIYEVDLSIREIPSFFRSGMNATVDFIIDYKDSALLLPQEAVMKNEADSFVLIKSKNTKALTRAIVTTGISDDKNIEIISGVSENDTVIIKTMKYSLPKNDSTGTNPFMPARRR